MSKEFFQGIMNSINPNPPVSLPPTAPISTQPSAITASPTPQGITVQSGDTLGRLGAQHGFDYKNAQIMRDGRAYNIGNGVGDIDPNQIRVGDQVIPNPKTPAIEEAIKAADEQGSERDVEEICQKCTQCELVTPEMLKSIFSKAADTDLQIMADELNYSISIGKLDTHERISYFLGQCRHEGARKILVSESLNYKETALSLFSYYRKNPAKAKQHGRNKDHKADQEAIANHAYAGRIGNGDISTGDGWKYRGRGIKQLTGRDNYRAFTKSHKRLWGEAIDFEDKPDLLSTDAKYAVRSAISFWVDNKLYSLAGKGVTKTASNKISYRINPGEQPPNSNRYDFSKSIFDSKNFQNICFNKNNLNSNKKAKVPK